MKLLIKDTLCDKLVMDYKITDCLNANPFEEGLRILKYAPTCTYATFKDFARNIIQLDESRYTQSFGILSCVLVDYDNQSNGLR